MTNAQRAIADNAIELRRATAEDSEAIWRWNNQPDVRAQSFDSKPIPRDIHERWMATRLADPATKMWIIETSGGPIGIVRVQQDGAFGRISIALDATLRGRGQGRAALGRAAEIDGRDIIADIAADNLPSIKMILACGFLKTGEYETGDGRLIFVYERKVNHEV